jgi:hypothetical protein
MTPDGQLLSADSFQLLMSDGSSSSSCLLQAEDIQALLSSSSSPTAAVGNSPPGPPRSAVDHHRHLGLTASATPKPTNKQVEMASRGLPETAEHRHLAVSSSGVPQSADNRRMVVTSSTMPNTVDHQRFESPTCAGGPSPAGTVTNSSPRQPPGHVMFGETIARSATGSAHQTRVDRLLPAQESPSNILPNGELSPVGGRTTDPAGGKINNPAQYFVTKCGTTAATGSRRVHKSVAKNNNYSSSSCPSTATTEVAAPPKVLVTRNMIAGRPIAGVSGSGGSAAKAPTLPPEIVFPREPLLPAEIQGFVSGLGYSAGDLPPFAASATPPPAVVMVPPPAATGGKGSARSTPFSSNKSRSRTKENMKVPAAVYLFMDLQFIRPPYVMLLMRANPLRGQVEGGWAL